jgi:hypothetical protein
MGFPFVKGLKTGGWCRDYTHAARRLTRFSGPGHYCSANHPKWSGWQELHLRPPVPKPGALKTELSRPHQPGCRAGALLVCHDPVKLAGRLGADPSGLSFGDSAARAGARPVEDWCGCRASHPVGGRPQGPPWRGGILAVKSQPRKLKGPEASLLPAPAISTKNKHLLLACATNPRIHGGCFGV